MTSEMKSPGDISSFGDRGGSPFAAEADPTPSLCSGTDSLFARVNFNYGGTSSLVTRTPLKLSQEDATPTSSLGAEDNWQASANESAAGRVLVDCGRPSRLNISGNSSSPSGRGRRRHPTGTECAMVQSELLMLLSKSQMDMPSSPLAPDPDSPATALQRCAYTAALDKQNTPPLYRRTSSESAQSVRTRADSGVSNVNISPGFQCDICKRHVLPAEGWRSRSSTCSSVDGPWSASMDDSLRPQHLAHTGTGTTSGDHAQESTRSCQAQICVNSDRFPDQLSSDDTRCFEESANDSPRAGFKRTASTTESAYGSLQRHMSLRPQQRICDECRQRPPTQLPVRSNSVESPELETSDWYYVDAKEVPPDEQVGNSRDSAASSWFPLFQRVKNTVVSFWPLQWRP